MIELQSIYNTCVVNNVEVLYSDTYNKENPERIVMGHNYGFCCVDGITSKCISCNTITKNKFNDVVSCVFGADDRIIYFTQENNVCMRDLRVSSYIPLFELPHIVEHLCIGHENNLIAVDEDGCHNYVYHIRSNCVTHQQNSDTQSDLGCIGAYYNENEIFSNDTLFSTVFMNGTMRLYSNKGMDLNVEKKSFITQQDLIDLASNDMCAPLINHIDICVDDTSEDHLNLLLCSTASGHLILCESDISKESWDTVTIWRAHNRTGAIFVASLNHPSIEELKLVSIGNDKYLRLWTYNWETDKQSLLHQTILPSKINHVHLSQPYTKDHLSNNIFIADSNSNRLYFYRINNKI